MLYANAQLFSCACICSTPVPLQVYEDLQEDEYGNKIDARFLPHLAAQQRRRAGGALRFGSVPALLHNVQMHNTYCIAFFV